MEPEFLTDDFGTDLDLTPLIDVIFMLLLFFILASTFSPPVLQVLLPTAGTAERAPDDAFRLVLTIDAEGGLYHLQVPIKVENVGALLAAAVDGPIELRVDRAAPFDAFVDVLDRVRAAGRNDVLITAQSE